MSEVNATAPQITIVLRGEGSERSLISEGDLDMSAEEQTQLKSIIGDGLAKVTVSKELSHKDYGNGGSVFVAITLTCDQSPEIIDYAAKAASHHVEKNVVEHHNNLKQTLDQLGITP